MRCHSFAGVSREAADERHCFGVETVSTISYPLATSPFSTPDRSPSE